MSSLPHLGRLFANQPVPCSGYKLANRLNMLTAQDLALLHEIEHLLHWIFHGLTRSDADIVATADELIPRLRKRSVVLAELAQQLLERRSVIAALRRRHRGENAPPKTRWGYGRWLTHIARYWNESYFQLELVYPWLPEAERLLQEDATLALERLLLRTKWEELERAAQGHYFDFEAVVIYVLRWNIVYRWRIYSAEAAAQRFSALVEEGCQDLVEKVNA
jgi:hypothetical protein